MNESQEIEYRPSKKIFPNYRLDQLTQQIGGTTFTPAQAGGQTSIFELPSVAYNLSRSFLCFDFTIPNPSTAAHYNVVFQSMLPLIQQIQFYGKNNIPMFDLTNFARYTKIIFNGCQSLTDLLEGSNTTPLHRNNLAAAAAAQSSRPNGSASNLAYTEQQYVISGAVAAGAPVASGAITVQYRIPLSMFKNSILALDKDLYFGDITYFKIYWAPWTIWGFDTTDSATFGGNNTAFTGTAANFSIDNLYFYQAVETNQAIIDTLKATVESPTGLSMLIDYIHTTSIPVAAGAQQAFYTKYGSGMGLRLKRIYWMPQNNGLTINQVNLTYDSSNVNGAKITSFYTMLDSQRIIQYNIDCTDANGNQDYMIMDRRLRGSAIQNRNIYQANWFWCESFDGMKLHEFDDNLEVGIPIDTIERKYDYVGTLNAASIVPNTYYVFAVVQRRLTITKLGVSVI